MSDLSEEGQGGKNLPSSVFSYGKVFEAKCPEYMAMGMSYSDYWDGEPEMTKAYREAYYIKRDNKNFYLWLQGMYVYEAIADIAPVLIPFNKEAQILPYRSEPISLSQAQAEKAKEEANKRKLERGKTAMMNMAMAVNKGFSKEGGDLNG